jgi:CubicO group peptidase (beta-lactamase class C family)
MMQASVVARLMAMSLIVLVGGCDPGGSEEPAAGPATATPSPSDQAGTISTATFSGISEKPVSEELAARFQAAVDEISDMVDGGGVSATVMLPDGTWSGTAGGADNLRDVRLHDQFAIGSLTKSVVSAQVMQMVEAGELALDDPADDHLPPDLDFDTNRATIRQLLGMRSGIPDYWPKLDKSLSTIRIAPGRPPPCWSWSPPSAFRLVMPSSTPTPTISCSSP